MEDNFTFGLLLMVVGMTTVFAALILVILSGRLLIKMVNRFAPEESVVAKKSAAAVNQIDSRTAAIIAAAVNALTGGRGHVQNIEKK